MAKNNARGARGQALFFEPGYLLGGQGVAGELDGVLDLDCPFLGGDLEAQEDHGLPKGRLRLVLPLNSTLEVLPWILSWGPVVEVVEPADLRRMVADAARKMASNNA